MSKGFKCCICGKQVDNDYGNNPIPVKPNGRCCDACNIDYVIPARIRRAVFKKEEEDD